MSSLRERIASEVRAWLDSPDDLVGNAEMAGQIADVAMTAVQPEFDVRDGVIARLQERLDGFREGAAADLQQAEAERDRLRTELDTMTCRYNAANAMARVGDRYLAKLHKRNAAIKRAGELAEAAKRTGCGAGWDLDPATILAALDEPEDQPETP